MTNASAVTTIKMSPERYATLQYWICSYLWDRKQMGDTCPQWINTAPALWAEAEMRYNALAAK